MKKAVFLTVLMCAIFVINAQAESIDGFENAEYSKFNTYADENGLGGTQIYFEGTVHSKVVGESLVGLIIRQGDENYWIFAVSDEPSKAEQIADGLIGKQIRIFGEYTGFSGIFRMPCIQFTKDGQKIQIVNENNEYQDYWTFSDWVSSLDGEGENNLDSVTKPNETITLGAGIYVVGEDIAEGKYDFVALNGSGTLRTYKNYEQFHAEEYDYEMQYELAAEDSSAMSMFGDMYGTSASNVRLENGECFVISSGLELRVTSK